MAGNNQQGNTQQPNAGSSGVSGVETSHAGTGEPRPTLGELTSVFFRIGNTTFGGGIPTIAALQRELVDRKDWLSNEEYGLAFALARVTPGTTIIAFCTATGAQISGIAGAMAGTLAVTLPSAALAVMITVGYETWRSHPAVLAAIGGTVAAVAGMMLATVWSLIRPYWGGFQRAGLAQSFRTLVFAGGAFAALWYGVSPLTIIAVAVIAGWLWKEPGKTESAKKEPA